MEKLSELEDPGQPSNGTRHDVREILVIAVCAMLSDADSFEDIALWGRLKADWLRRFLVLQNGIPSQDTFLRVFAPEALQRGFVVGNPRVDKNDVLRVHVVWTFLEKKRRIDSDAYVRAARCSIRLASI